MADANFERRDINLDTLNTVEELHEAEKTWQLLRDSQLTDMDYHDWIRAYGVTPIDTKSAEVKDLHRPELLRHIREWTYPTNTIDPVTGTPSSAALRPVARTAAVVLVVVLVSAGLLPADVLHVVQAQAAALFAL